MNHPFSAHASSRFTCLAQACGQSGARPMDSFAEPFATRPGRWW